MLEPVHCLPKWDRHLLVFPSSPFSTICLLEVALKKELTYSRSKICKHCVVKKNSCKFARLSCPDLTAQTPTLHGWRTLNDQFHERGIHSMYVHMQVQHLMRELSITYTNQTQQTIGVSSRAKKNKKENKTKSWEKRNKLVHKASKWMAEQKWQVQSEGGQGLRKRDMTEVQVRD